MITQMGKKITQDNTKRQVYMITHKRQKVTWCNTPRGERDTHKE
ncbi:MAG: hypothetical protein QIT36_gp066 [Methanophagales virus GBV301]|uniref:Uncharacterized protein n=1 Tax=Methanophagales virus GBV301 TaxID=2999280 RepID=A0A9E9A8E2_9CAUD|nr:MAG: hypothetical protein QIT36_gp066 [Methanophagales virus GBV301]WAE39490.1 MAG: hypothetical protein LDLAKGPJ_00066 [Methanophagales virus GBV301]